MIFLLTVNKLTKHYGKNRALNNVTLNIPTGSCYGLVGPNGAGKSTLLKILASVIEHYQGKMDIKNSDEKGFKRRIGYVPQTICLEETFSAYSNLCFFGKIYGLRGKELKNRALKILKNIGLINRGQDKVKHFSGGMKRRLNIGCALMHEPELIIMDEPTVGIDPQSRSYIFQMIKRLQQRGCTIIYATHYMEEIEKLCDYVAFIDHGEIIEKGDIRELLRRYTDSSLFVKVKDELPHVEISGEIIHRDGGMVLETDFPLQTMEQIVRHYRSHPENLEQLMLVQPRLEEVFFRLTGSALREGQTNIEAETKQGVV